jgi:hypothetical protein
MKLLQKWAFTLGLASLLMQAAPSHAARDVNGVRFEDQVVLGDQPLQLNGAGLRVKMIVKVYAVGLYVPRKDTSASSVISQPGPKSLRIVMLRDVSAEKLTDNLVKGIADNVSPGEQAVLKGRLDEMEAAMLRAGEATRGSVIQLDYLPAVGTHITVGGKPIGKDIAGEDFYRALLKIWLGNNPSDRDLKKDLLGLS